MPWVFRGVTLFASWQHFKCVRSVESRKFAVSMLILCTCVRVVNEVPAPNVESASSTAKSGPATNYMYLSISVSLYMIIFIFISSIYTFD